METSILRDVCSIPTAPFRESRVAAFIDRFIRDHPRLRGSQDQHGNILVELLGRETAAGRWIFVAHIDHPGMVARRTIDRRTVEAEFRGGVLAEYLRGTKVRFFTDNGEVSGTIVRAAAEKKSQRAKMIHARVANAVPAGTPGMFDLPPARMSGHRFHSRAIDDLGGAAAILAALEALHRRPPAAGIAALFTRAEEEGFVGAIAACIRPKLLRRTDRLISVECSAMQSYAPQGRGPIIRVGDKTSIFSSSLTYFLTRQAEALQKRGGGFAFQRALMPGGTCEATVFDAWGYESAALCIPLGNYHNMDRGRRRIAAEYIDIGDWSNLVKLIVAIGRRAHTYRPGNEPLLKRLERRFRKVRDRLRGRKIRP